MEKEDNLVQRHGSASEICRIYLKRIEHVCFKFDPEALEQRAGKREPGTTLVKQYRSGRGLDRQTHRADSHCDRDDGIRLDEGEDRLKQGGDTWGLGVPGGDGHRLRLLLLREQPLWQGVVMPCPLRALV